MEPAIQVEGLVKMFGETTALAGIDLVARPGTVLGLLGPNGSGKTTTVRVLATLLRPDAGRATVFGHDVVADAAEVRARIGLTGQYTAVDEALTGSQNLVLIARLLDLPRADARARAAELIERFRLVDAAGRKVRTYSGGMRRRLDLAASLIGRPDVLFLDEPTTGLDPRHRNEVWDQIRGLAADGVTVLLTTQYLEEADQLADDRPGPGAAARRHRPARRPRRAGRRGRAAPAESRRCLPDPDRPPGREGRRRDRRGGAGMTSTTTRSAPAAVFGPSTLRHGATLAWRGVVKTVNSPEALLDVTLQPVIFLLLFVYVFGGAIGGSTGNYLQFALPGVLVQTVVFASAGTGVGLADDLATGIFDRFRSLPISRSAPLLGAIGADLVRYVTSGVVKLAFGALLGFRSSAGPLAYVASMGLVTVFAFALCWVFTALAMVVRQPRSVQGLGALIMLPLTFASNVFVPSATMSGWLRAFVEINPVSQTATALRGLLTGGPVAAPATYALLSAAAVIAVFAPLAISLYRRRT